MCQLSTTIYCPFKGYLEVSLEWTTCILFKSLNKKVISSNLVVKKVSYYIRVKVNPPESRARGEWGWWDFEHMVTYEHGSIFMPQPTTPSVRVHTYYWLICLRIKGYQIFINSKNSQIVGFWFRSERELYWWTWLVVMVMGCSSFAMYVGVKRRWLALSCMLCDGWMAWQALMESSLVLRVLLLQCSVLSIFLIWSSYVGL